MITKFTLATVVFLAASSTVMADEQNAPHAGQMDTDGILSPGEVRNPNIDYDKAQRHGERHDDQRYDNKYNDSAARKDEDIKRDQREQYDWDRQHEEEQHHWWNW